MKLLNKVWINEWFWDWDSPSLSLNHESTLGHNRYRSIPSLCGRGIPAVATVPCMFLTPHHNVQYQHTHPVTPTHHTPHTHTYTSHISITHITKLLPEIISAMLNRYMVLTTPTN